MENGAWEKAWDLRRVTASVDTNLPFVTFKKKAKVLDIGCGNGSMLAGLKDQYGIDPVGIDIVGFNKTEHLFVKADAEYLPFKDEAFDVVYGLGSIEHCKNTKKTIDESYRVLKNEGQALFTVPNKRSLHTIIERPLRQALGLWIIGLEQSFTIEQVTMFFTQSGFSEVKHSLKPWDTSGHNILAKAYMKFDNGLGKLSKKWGFFVCVFGKKKKP